MQPWHAQLDLHYRFVGGRSLVHARHEGPLQVQKALYPEGVAVCHSVILHPPGGIAGGDALNLNVKLDLDAHALLTTPGATKWYKANGRQARQHIHVQADGVLEWLPQENIVFNAAQVASELSFELAPQARCIGWDIVALGRARSGETFDDGVFAQSIRLSVAGQLLWFERSRVIGGDALLSSSIGLDGKSVFACFWVYAPDLTTAHLEAARACLLHAAGEVDARGAEAVCGITQLTSSLMVARVLARSAEVARHLVCALWVALRPALLPGRAAQLPRIWAT